MLLMTFTTPILPITPAKDMAMVTKTYMDTLAVMPPRPSRDVNWEQYSNSGSISTLKPEYSARKPFFSVKPWRRTPIGRPVRPEMNMAMEGETRLMIRNTRTATGIRTRMLLWKAVFTEVMYSAMPC